MRTVLICHEDDPLNREGLARWLASCSELAGIIVLRETGQRKLRRVRREIKRTGLLNFLNVGAFRLYYRLFLAGKDDVWTQNTVESLTRSFPPIPASTRILLTSSPNSPEAESFLKTIQPDIMIARCKTLLKENIFSLAAKGTFVMHPGICPEYRNAHGCFWALANDDLERVGMTLLRIDKGVDTGPVYGYYRCRMDEVNDSHIVIQHRTVFDNLAQLAADLHEIHAGRATRIDTAGRKSATWGQPWLTSYLGWKQRARKRAAQR